jgi:hypothetical protein
MHRLISFGTTTLMVLAACGDSGPEPRTVKNPSIDTLNENDAGDLAEQKAAASEKGDGGAAKSENTCVGFAVSNLEEILTKQECEVPDKTPTTIENPDLKGKLEVKLTASPTKVAPGAKTDLQVTFTNKTKDNLTLFFRIDPVARFEVEAYDAKGKSRVDMPKGNPPPPPKGATPPPPADQKVAKFTLTANGSASVRVGWDAVRMTWAPEKVRGTASEKGYPRKPAGPLPKGKYQVKLVTPLIGVFEGAEHEMSAPKVDIEVGS